MRTFKSITDVDRFRDHSLHDTVKQLVSLIIADCPEYRPEDDGWLVLIESGDTDRVLDDLDMPYRLSEVPFEGVSHRVGRGLRRGHFITTYSNAAHDVYQRYILLIKPCPIDFFRQRNVGKDVFRKKTV